MDKQTTATLIILILCTTFICFGMIGCERLYIESTGKSSMQNRVIR